MVERKTILINDLKLDDFCSRTAIWVGDEQDQMLLNSIKAMGLIQDVIVRPYSGAYSIIVGGRRVLALKEAGKTEVDCKVLDVDDLETLKLSMGENLGRKDLTGAEMTNAINTWYHMVENPENITEKLGLREEGKGTIYDPEAVEEIAQAIYGRVTDSSKKVIQQHLRISRLPTELTILLKEPTKRTPQEVRVLEDAGIDPSYKVGYDAMDSISGIARQLGIEEDETRDEALRQTLKLIRELDLPSMDATKQVTVLRLFRGKLDEGKSYRLSLDEILESPEVSIKTTIAVNLIIPAEYVGWHKRMLQETGRKHNIDLVRDVYFDYLKREAKKRGWT